MGWWEADIKTERYICSEFISDLLGLDEDGTISFKDFNARILKEDQHHTTVSSFNALPKAMGKSFFTRHPQRRSVDT